MIMRRSPPKSPRPEASHAEARAMAQMLAELRDKNVILHQQVPARLTVLVIQTTTFQMTPYPHRDE